MEIDPDMISTDSEEGLDLQRRGLDALVELGRHGVVGITILPSGRSAQRITVTVSLLSGKRGHVSRMVPEADLVENPALMPLLVAVSLEELREQLPEIKAGRR